MNRYWEEQNAKQAERVAKQVEKRARKAQDAALARAEKAEKERDEARDWVRRLTREQRVLTCVYCGQAYPPGSPTHGAEVLTEHIKVCAKHPLRAAEARVAELEEEVRLWKCLDFESPAEATKEWNIMDARIMELERDLAAARAEVERLMTLASDLRLSRDRLFNRQEALRARCEALEKALRDIARRDRPADVEGLRRAADALLAPTPAPLCACGIPEDEPGHGTVRCKPWREKLPSEPCAAPAPEVKK